MKVNFNRYQVTKWMLKQCLMLRERLQLKVVWDVFYNHSTWGLLGAACLCTTSTCTALGDARVDEWNSDYPLGWEHYFSAAMTSQNCLCYKGNICIGLSASNILQQSSCQRWEHWSEWLNAVAEEHLPNRRNQSSSAKEQHGFMECQGCHSRKGSRAHFVSEFWGSKASTCLRVFDPRSRGWWVWWWG